MLFIYLGIKALGKNYNSSKFSKLNFLCTNCITSLSITFIDEVFFKKRSTNNLRVGEIPLLCIKGEAGLSTVVDSSSYSTFPVLHTNWIWIFFCVFYFLAFKAWAAGRKLGSCILFIFMLVADFRSWYKKCMNYWVFSHLFGEAICSDFTNLTNPLPFFGLW